MNALALTDQGNLFGALEFYRACKAAGIKPIIGYEAFVTAGSRHDRSDEGAYYSLTLLAQNNEGFKNLIKLSSAAFIRGIHYRPEIDKQLLEVYSAGVVCLSGNLDSELAEPGH